MFGIEVKKLLLTDPAIKSGILAFEIYEWYGAAGLPEYLKIQDKLGRFKI